jgi:WXG100 family type VII secretion target
MSQIRATPDQLRARSTDYKRKSEEVSAIITQMNSLIAQLQDEFEGLTAKAFEERYLAIRPSFENCVTMTEEISQALLDTAQNFEQLDQQGASAVGV